jgi:hypothetical protein
MKLRAVLAYGWKERRDLPFATDWDLAALKEEESDGYDAELASVVKGHTEVQGVDKLFRRRGQAGVDPIKRFVKGLLNCDEDGTLTCHIDYFAYVFLKGAKNFDFFFPAYKEESKPQMEPLFGSGGIRSLIKALQEFELTGVGCSLHNDIKSTYLEARPLAQRESARDEWRTLAVLLYSGPSTLESVSKDLGLGYTLAERLFVPFLDCGLLKKEANIYCLETKTAKMAVTLTLLRAVLGLNPLSEEPTLWKQS